MHDMHALVPAAALAVAGKMVRPAAAVGGLAQVQALMMRIQQARVHLFQFRRWPRRHFERSFFGIVTEAFTVTNIKKTQSEEHRKIMFLQGQTGSTSQKKKKKVMQVTLAGYNLTLDLPLLKGSRAQLHL